MRHLTLGEGKTMSGNKEITAVPGCKPVIRINFLEERTLGNSAIDLSARPQSRRCSRVYTATAIAIELRERTLGNSAIDLSARPQSRRCSRVYTATAIAIELRVSSSACVVAIVIRSSRREHLATARLVSMPAHSHGCAVERTLGNSAFGLPARPQSRRYSRVYTATAYAIELRVAVLSQKVIKY
ncbi:hypothetical protein J6590_038848 [Homalodisca vitripennis]|nr:hypothetical protein J6590_038848 [Homalodisca vitripennis]